MNRVEKRSRSKQDIENGKVFQECVRKTATLLAESFKDGPEKIVYWLYTTNHHFGGTCPAAFMHLRPSKYLEILESLKNS